MECECIEVDHDGFAELLAIEERRAKKQHKCTECKKIIKPKETYTYEKTMYDGDTEEWKTCLDCLSVREAFFCHGFILGEIWSLLWDHFMNDGIDDCFGKKVLKLTEGAKEKVLKLMDEYREKHEDD